MADVRGLSQAMGQITGQVLSGMREAKRLEMQQAQVDAANNIVRQALDLDSKLAGKDTTPFLRQKKVFEFIADNERMSGLPIGTALGAYKQFFGVTGGGEGKAGYGSWKELSSGRTGKTLYNPENPKETVFIPVPEEALLAEDSYNKRMAYSDDVSKILTASGFIEKYGPEVTADLARNPARIPQYPEAQAAVNMARAKSDISDRITMAEGHGKLKSAEIKNAYRENQVGDHLVEFANNLVSQFETNKDLTIEEARKRMSAQIADISKDAPKEFTDLYGDLKNHIDTLITNAHPTTKFDAKVSKYKSKQAMIDTEINILRAVATRTMLGDKSARMVDTQVRTLKGLDPGMLDRISLASGMKGREVLETLGNSVEAIGDEELFNQRLDDYGINFLRDVTPEEVDTKVMPEDGTAPKVSPMETKTAQSMFNWISRIYKPKDKMTGDDIMHNMAMLTMIKKNKAAKEMVMNTTKEILDELIKKDPNHKAVKLMINFRSQLEEE